MYADGRRDHMAVVQRCENRIHNQIICDRKFSSLPGTLTSSRTRGPAPTGNSLIEWTWNVGQAGTSGWFNNRMKDIISALYVVMWRYVRTETTKCFHPVWQRCCLLGVSLFVYGGLYFWTHEDLQHKHQTQLTQRSRDRLETLPGQFVDDVCAHELTWLNPEVITLKLVCTRSLLLAVCG